MTRTGEWGIPSVYGILLDNRGELAYGVYVKTRRYKRLKLTRYLSINFANLIKSYVFIGFC